MLIYFLIGALLAAITVYISFTFIHKYSEFLEEVLYEDLEKDTIIGALTVIALAMLLVWPLAFPLWLIILIILFIVAKKTSEEDKTDG